MQVHVKYFAAIREALGLAAQTIETDAQTVGALRDALIARGEPYASALARGKAVRAALNQVMLDEAAPLSEGAEVAFFPPVTGG